MQKLVEENGQFFSPKDLLQKSSKLIIKKWAEMQYADSRDQCIALKKLSPNFWRFWTKITAAYAEKMIIT
jgi:hypothetical protein